MSEAEQRLRKVRSHVVQQHPFYAGLLLKQELIEGGCETMATNGKQLKFNTDYVLGASPEDLYFTICH